MEDKVGHRLTGRSCSIGQSLLFSLCREWSRNSPLLGGKRKTGNQQNSIHLHHHHHRMHPNSHDVKLRITPLELLSKRLSLDLLRSRMNSSFAGVMCFGKSDFFLGLPLSKTSANMVTRPQLISILDTSTRYSHNEVIASHTEGNEMSIPPHDLSSRRARRRDLNQTSTDASRIGPSIPPFAPSNSTSSSYPPHLIGGVVQVVANKYHSCAVTSTGEVFTWGHGRGGKLGHGDEAPRAEPCLVTALCRSLQSKKHIRHVAAGENHTLALSDRYVLVRMYMCISLPLYTSCVLNHLTIPLPLCSSSFPSSTAVYCTPGGATVLVN